MPCPKCGQDNEHYKGQWYCKACSKAQQAQWTRDNRKRKADINRAWRKRHASRRKVMVASQCAIFHAIRSGKLERGKVCAFCETTEHIEAAHTDYGKPLEVIWLCRSCHRQWDAITPKSH